MTQPPRASKWVLAIARWALLFGLIGVGCVVTTWFTANRAQPQGEDALRLFGLAFLALAFVLAPFVRNAFKLPSLSPQRSRPAHKTTLDELRGESDTEEPPRAEKLTPMARVVIALYVVYAIVLIAALIAR
jgi:small-conductance mechanosensitive channel